MARTLLQLTHRTIGIFTSLVGNTPKGALLDGSTAVQGSADSGIRGTGSEELITQEYQDDGVTAEDVTSDPLDTVDESLTGIVLRI